MYKKCMNKGCNTMIDVNHCGTSKQCSRCVRIHGRLLRNGKRQKRCLNARY